MHVHLPKPLHGWRQFAGEVGIIVIGVLIALGAEQVVEGMHRREAAGAIESAMDRELTEDRGRWDTMILSQHCAGRQLDQLEMWSRTAPAAERPIKGDYGPDVFFSHTSAWQMAKSGDILTYVPLGRRLAYSGLYDHLELLQQWITQDFNAWTNVNMALANSDDPASRGELRRAVFQAHMYGDALKQNYKVLTKEFDQLGIKSERPATPKSSTVCPDVQLSR